MSDKEVYLKVKNESGQNSALFGYVYKDSDGVMILANHLPLSFEHGEEYNLKKMMEISSKENFVFWSNSDEGEEWINRVVKEIIESKTEYD